MAERPDVLAAAEPFVQQCGPCDFGVIEVGCACPPGDYRPVMVRLMDEVRRLRAELADVRVIAEKATHYVTCDEKEAETGEPYQALVHAVRVHERHARQACAAHSKETTP